MVVARRRPVGVLAHRATEGSRHEPGAPYAGPMKTIQRTLQRLQTAQATGDAAVIGTVVLAAIALTFLGI